MEQLKQQLQAAGILYKENEPLSAHCTFRIGGPADLFVMPRDEDQLCQTVQFCKQAEIRYYLLGNGSNILFADEGFRGAVIDVSAEAAGMGLSIYQNADGDYISAPAGLKICPPARLHRAGICLWHPRHGGRCRLHERRCLRRRNEGCAGSRQLSHRRRPLGGQ